MASIDPEIRILPTSGGPVHHGKGHPHAIPGGIDYIELGSNALGSLGYSLIRSEFLSLNGHRRRALVRLAKRFYELADYVEGVRLIDRREADKVSRQNSRLLFWDLVRGLSESCEQLAALYSAARAQERNKDVGLALLGWSTNVLETVQSPGFSDYEWWRTKLGWPVRGAHLKQLPEDQELAVLAIFAGVNVRLEPAIRTVVAGYSLAVHRVAMKGKHGSPLLDAHLSVGAGSGDASTDTWIEAQVDDGALVVADDRAGLPGVGQIVVPATQETGDMLFSAWKEANWLAHALAGGMLSRGEHPSHLAIPGDNPEGPRYGSTDALRHGIAHYSGIPWSQWEMEREIDGHTARVRRLAESLPIRWWVRGSRWRRGLPSRLRARLQRSIQEP
jgi:hypothetical protein